MPIPGINLRPFGFTETESRVYAVLLKLGATTGYSLARAAHLARANAYGALDGLVLRGAAARAAGRPARYRPTDPQTLLARLAGEQGEALEELSRALAEVTRPAEPDTRFVTGSRALANVVLQVVARAERTVRGVVSPELLRQSLPAWRRARERASLDVGVTGPMPPEAQSLGLRSMAEFPTVLLIDERQTIAVAPGTDSGVLSSHSSIVELARTALRAQP